MWKWLNQPRLRARIILAWLLLLLVGCNLNQSPTAETQAITGAPTVQIIAPQPNAIYREGVCVPIQAQIANAGAVEQTFASPNTAAALVFPITHTWTATGAGPHSIDVVAYRADETSSASAAVSVTVVAETGLETQETRPTARPTTGAAGGGQASPSPQASNTPANTQPPAATATSTRPQVTTQQGVNVRSGPGTVFNPPIGSLAAGQTVDLLGRNPAGDWYKIRYYNGEGWVFASLVQVSGDTSNLPIDPGPATPAPTALPVPTAIPATAAPATSANLVAGNWRFDPAGDPVCGQTFNIFFDVANLGSQATANSGSVSVRDVRASDGSQQANTIGGFGIIQPGQTINVGPIPLTISTYYNELHRLILTINADNTVPETSNADNVREITFTLQKGGCP